MSNDVSFSLDRECEDVVVKKCRDRCEGAGVAVGVEDGEELALVPVVASLDDRRCRAAPPRKFPGPSPSCDLRPVLATT